MGAISLFGTGGSKKPHKEETKFAAPPEEVPESVKETYGQACFLIDVSPKAGGALARNCLQQIIYDFWKTSPKAKGTLSAELDSLSSKLPPETKGSIEFVRNFGNIDDQLAEDVNMMVDTSVAEAKMLVALIQILFQDWYLERRSRQERHERLQEIALELGRDIPLELTNEVTPPAAKKTNGKARAAAKSSTAASKETANKTTTSASSDS